MVVYMKLHLFTLILPLIPLIAPFAESKKTGEAENFRLKPAIGGGQSGWLDAKDLPTAIKINNQWVLPRGGTMEWLMKKGYVTDPKNNHVMRPNPFDKRYKEPRQLILPPLATRPVDFIYTGTSPRFKKSNDPFEGLADPMKRKYSPIPGAGANPGLPGNKNELGPVLNPDPELPTLKNSPFAPPPNPFQQPPQRNIPETAGKLPKQDPFANELDNPLNPVPAQNLKVLPGNPIDSLPEKSNPFLPEQPGT
jgi:hypothetical protein